MNFKFWRIKIMSEFFGTAYYNWTSLTSKRFTYTQMCTEHLALSRNFVCTGPQNCSSIKGEGKNVARKDGNCIPHMSQGNFIAPKSWAHTLLPRKCVHVYWAFCLLCPIVKVLFLGNAGTCVSGAMSLQKFSEAYKVKVFDAIML